MLPYFLLGIALLAGLIVAGHWFARADPRLLAKVFKRLAFALIVGVALYLVLTGRLAWALFALPALVPWFLRLRALGRTAKAYSRMSAAMRGGPGAGTGQASEVETRFLRMFLDHDSGAMTGEVVSGAYAGRRLDQMPLAELLELLKTCWDEDQQSAQVLEAYLNRVHGNWREEAAKAGGRGTEAFDEGPMSRDEAHRILGLDPGAGAEEIKEAYHRLMAGLHPDHGGSTYLAAKINQAKDVLLGN